MKARHALIIAVIGAQATVPAYVLFSQPRPARFGWQMFAAKPSQFTVDLEQAGRIRSVDSAAHLDLYRPEIDYAPAIAREVCRNAPGANAVIVRRSSPPLDARLPCR